MRSFHTLPLLSSSLSGFAHAVIGPLHTSGRWIVDDSENRVKLRCVNWGGHTEVRIPEGLQYQPVESIADWISDNGFNCVRLTYATEGVLDSTVSVKDSFNNAAGVSRVPMRYLQSAYTDATGKNPWLASATTEETFSAVISALADRDIMVWLDNHVSHASWCCNPGDGNGWWDSAEGFDSENSRYFVTSFWLNGLEHMAEFAKGHTNVVGMSIRNELRAVRGQDQDSHIDWYNLVSQGASKIHDTNKDLLISISGVKSATDMSFLGSDPLDLGNWPNRTVWELHSYYWSYPGVTQDCDKYQAALGWSAGYLLTEGQPYTGPLWLSEFGVEQVTDSNPENNFERDALTCLVDWMESNDADWGIWALQGSYYVRQGQVDADESYGLLNHDWSGWRNETFKDALGGMFDVNQGP